jgi:DNA repair protein RecO (recombination protein O)
MPSVRTPALVLRKFEFGETSQVLHLLTRDHGRVHALAKGSLKEGSAFLGPLDVLELGDARIYPRRDALAILGSFERETGFPGARRVLERLEGAFAVLEILAEASREDQADPADRVPIAVLRFDLDALGVLGVGPVLGACVVCGRVLATEKAPMLSPARGGALCGGCAGQDPLALPATRGVLAALAGISEGTRVALGPRDLRLARRLVDGLLRHAFEKAVRGTGRRKRARRPAATSRPAPPA